MSMRRWICCWNKRMARTTPPGGSTASSSSSGYYTANLSGKLFDLPAGPVGFAIGYEHRFQKGNFDPDPIIDVLAVDENLAGEARRRNELVHTV